MRVRRGFADDLLGRRLVGDQKDYQLRRGAWLAAMGVVVGLIGLAFLAVSERGHPAFSVGTVLATVGVSILAAAAVQVCWTMVLRRRW